MSKKLLAGGYVASYCTKCKMDLGHTIIAMSGVNVARVKCRTCNSEHNFRDSTKKRTGVKKISTSARKSATSKNLLRSWKEAIADGSGPDIPYDMAGNFSVNDCLFHRSFGRGVVLAVSEKKINVIFEDKERVLISSK